MRRRRLLAVLAATGGSSLAGCAKRFAIGSGSGSSAGASARSPESPSVSATRAGTRAADSEACPPIGASAVCYREGSRNGSSNASVALVPSTESVSLAGEFVGFALHNRSDFELSFRPYGWQIWRRLDDWARIDGGGDQGSVGETVLSPGGSYGWQVAVGPVTAEADRPPVTVNDVEFEPGRYAFAVRARGEEKRTYVAGFDVIG